MRIVAVSFQQTFGSRRFLQLDELGVAAGQQDVFECQRFGLGRAAFDHRPSVRAVAVRAQW